MSVKILRVKFRAVFKEEPKLMMAVADYGHGSEVEIPLPCHFLGSDDRATIDAEIAQGMESLAKALLAYVHRKRMRKSHDPLP